VASVASQAPFNISAAIDPTPPLPPEVRSRCIAWCRRPCTILIVKHAQARCVDVDLRATPAAAAGEEAWRGEIAIEIADDGRGIESAQVAPQHMGLRIMGERAASIGASLTIVSARDRGTRLTIVWRGGAVGSEEVDA